MLEMNFKNIFFNIQFLIFYSECSFVTKIINAQECGALGVIVMDNDRTADDSFVDMIDDKTKRNVLIPAMFLQYKDGYDRKFYRLDAFYGFPGNSIKPRHESYRRYMERHALRVCVSE